MERKHSYGGGLLLAASFVAASLTACGARSDGSPHAPGSSVAGSLTRGALAQNPPPLMSSMTATTLAQDLTSDSNPSGGLTVLTDVLMVAGIPQCDINIYHIQYGTLGGKGESTTASAALMVPSGSGAACTGPRPIVL